MTGGLDLVDFLLAATVSLFMSWLLVSRIERIGERLGLSEALLGMAAALAADAPEITSAVTALLHGERNVAAGVVLGSNVFNLAALLGLGAVVAGWVGLHRRVVALGGSVGMWIASVSLLAILGTVTAPVGLTLVLMVFVPYTALLTRPGRRVSSRMFPRRVASWMVHAVSEEESELYEAIRPRRGGPVDVATAAAALLVVVGASTLMERTGSDLGRLHAVPGVVVGGLLLAAVTSLPNAVAAVYLAARGRGAAALSTALNSNAINVVAGMLVPGTILGLPRPALGGDLEGGWYLGLTALTLVLAYTGRGLSRARGLAIVGAYIAFVALVLAY